MLTTIHVTVAINGKDRKRPLRVYGAGKFGVVVAGVCVPVTPTGKASVKLDPKGAPKATDTCRAAKLADIGIEAKPRTVKATGEIALTPDLIARVLAHIASQAAE